MGQFPNPYANEAANGSFIILITFNPAISPATLVACFGLSVKYAGTVITTFLIVFWRNFSALFINFANIFAEISSGENAFIPFELTSIWGLPLSFFII